MLIGALAALVSIRVSAEGADGILECKAKVPNRTSVALAKKRNIGPWKMQQHGKCHMASDENRLHFDYDIWLAAANQDT